MTSFAYNPGLEDAETIIRTFVARRDLFAAVVEGLQARQPEHHLFVGQRGMGKTTLLRRLAAEVDRAPALRDRWVALTFPEEQYNVGRLSDFWLNCLDALADAAERAGDTTTAAELDSFVADLPGDEPRRAALALDRLLAAAGDQRGLALFVDNLQQVFDRLDKDARWALRKVLGGEHRLVLVAASAGQPAGTIDYGEPFYDFFHTHWLRGLDLAETTEVLRTLATSSGDAAFVEAVARHPGRVRALHVLTGGNPRTIVLLSHVLARAPGSDVRAQLEGLVDQSTPLYKARFEALADQAQIVLDALALHWDPATAAEIAAAANLEVNTVSVQLQRLYLEGIVEKVDLPGVARQGFQVAERFFNLWYLMRASRRLRGRVLALAKCLESLYEAGELTALGTKLAVNPEDPDLMVALGRAVGDESLKRALWSGVIDEVGASTERLRELLAQLGPGDGAIRDLAERKRVVAERLEEVKAYDFEGKGVDREIGELLFTFMADWHTGTPLLGLADVPAADELDDFLQLVAFMHWFRGQLGPLGWAAFRDGIRNGVIQNLEQALTEPGVEVAAAGLRSGCPHLAVLINVVRAQRAEDLPAIDLMLASGDAHLLSLAALKAASPDDLCLAMEATRIAPGDVEAWESTCLVHLDRSSGDRAEALPSARRALALGSRQELVIALGVASLRTDTDFRELADRALDPAQSPPPALLASLAAHFPRFASPYRRRLWDRYAALHDPLDPPDRFHAFLHILLAEGRSAEALEIVTPLRDRALPVYAAVVAAHGKDPSLLRRFAPEVAGPARDVLARIWPESMSQPEAPRPKRRR